MSDLKKDDVLKALAAAEFAAAYTLFLDVLVTLDFERIGITDPHEGNAELQRFLKSANSWLAERWLPVVWIACLERGRAGNLHAHIAMHVPGMRKDDEGLHGIRYRSHFRIWAREAVGRRVGKIIPRAVNVRCSLVPSIIAHWICVGYLLKGFDRSAVLMGARNRPDGEELRLGDILPFHYRNPGDVGLSRRLFISGNLGPARRLIGAPPIAEFMLPHKPDLTGLQLILDPGKTDQPKLARRVQPRPFRAKVEDGDFDVRRIYGAEFTQFVKGVRPPVPGIPIPEDIIQNEPDLMTWLLDLGV